MLSFATTSDYCAFEDATALIEKFGEHAGFEAAALAERSRGLGNHVHFCRWRQVERLIMTLSDTRSSGTIH